MRQKDHNTVSQIEELIKTAVDPDQKGVLLILLRVAMMLDDNIASHNASENRVASLDADITKKIEDLDNLKTFSMGFLRGIVVIWVVVQSAIGYVLHDIYQDYKLHLTISHDAINRISILEAKAPK